MDKNRNGVYLTNKKSLVNSKLPILTSYDQLKVGLVTEGVIGTIKDNGVVVFFYGGMKVRCYYACASMGYESEML